MENLTNKTTNWCVYMHEHRETGKKYIGVTCQKPTKRWKNGEGYKNNAAFYADITTDGWDAFRHELLFTELTQDAAEEIEVALIAKYQTRDPKKGYNTEAGGGVSLPTESTKQKIGDAMRGRELSEQHKIRLSEAARRHPGNMTGKHHTEEGKKHISEALRGHSVSESTREKLKAHFSGAKSPRARAVRCLDTGVIYRAVSEAALATGAEATSIVRCCKGQLQRAGGFHWEYVQEGGQK